MILEAVFLGLYLSAVVSLVVYTYSTGISPVPSTRRARARVFELVPEGAAGTIVDLGSGWGTLAFRLARRHPACRVVGYELSPVPWLFSQARRLVQPRPNLALLRKDFFGVPLSGAAIVVCYLWPEGMRRLREKFERELTPGTIVVSNHFPVPGWKPAATLPVGDFFTREVYLYRIPPPPAE
ncbi:MAG: class I SAM-dependent methyltransferase [Planctomycetes bacterium]|nr:class I SAM-dependent methyltransferase [Planctomycetota bacterium]